MASEIRVNKIENRSGLGTVTFADTGVDLAGIVTATTFSGSGASLTNLPAGNLSGTLPALDGSALTGVASTENIRTNTNATFLQNINVSGITTVGSAVTISESGIEASGIGITCANINGGQIGGRKNVLFNGAMQVAQRGTSFTSVGASANTFTLDRWKIYVQNSTARFTVTQDSESPDEFGGSMKIDCTTTDTSLASTDEVYLEQRLEGQDLQHFAKGTSSAKQYTLSFYAKTNKTGTYIVNLLSRDNTTGSVSAAYTVSDTNWNRYVITFPADTSSNRKDDNDNGEALRVLWWFVAGSAVNSGTLNTSWANSSDTGRATGQLNFADSTSNYFYLTGCQLEVGPQASAYEHRSFGDELLLCQRYFQIFAAPDGEYTRFGLAAASASNSVRIPIHHIVEMRSKATFSYTGGNSDYQMPGSSNGFNISQVIVENNTGSTRSTVLQNGYVSVTAYQVFQFSANAGSDAALLFDAEL